MAHKSNAQSSYEEWWEVWYGGEDFRYVQRNTEEEAFAEADALVTAGQTNIRVFKVVHDKTLIDYEPVSLETGEPVPADLPHLSG